MRSWPLALVVCVACGAAVPALPSQGGPRWIELTSPHFTLWTDTDEARAKELVGEMEHLRQVVLETSFTSVAADAKAFVIAVRDEAELHAYMPDLFEAEAFPAHGDAIRQAMVILAAKRSHAGEERIEAHELTHVISYGMIHDQPRWFAEGLAKFFETIRMDDHSADIGRAPVRDDGRPMTIHHLISLRSMFACKTLACADPGFYATAWLLFNYLHNTHRAQLDYYMALLAAGEGDAAFAHAFSMPLDQLEGELRQWLVSGSHVVVHYNVRFRPFTVEQKTVSDADVRATRALLLSHVARVSRQAVFGEIDAALALDHTNVIANVLAVALRRPITTQAAAAITAAHPDDWRAWMLAAQSGDSTARAKACELASSNPAVELPWHCDAPAPSPASVPPSS